MISSYVKAIELRKKYSEVDAICQATQCLLAAPVNKKDYWWDVIQYIKNNEQGQYNRSY